MLKFVISCIAFPLLLVWAADIQPELKIVSVAREIDLRTQVANMIITVEVENAGQRPVKEYLMAFEPAIGKQLSHIEASKTVTNKQHKLSVKPHRVAQWKDETVFYAIIFGDELKPGAKLKLEVRAFFTHLLSPFPAAITQAEKQFVVYEASAVMFSPQNVVSQKTIFRLPTTSVESYTKDASVSPASHDGNQLIYGPYENIPAFSEKKVRVHFESNAPFLTVTQFNRLIEVSHWGNIAVEETLDVYHSGAKLKGPFSRYDFQRDHRSVMPAVKSFKTMLPASAADVYYRDEIGNISTSNLLHHDEAVELDIRPRFPLFGGWKTHYTIGYNVPSYEYLHRSGNKFMLQMRIVDHIFDHFSLDEAVIRIVLPERSIVRKLRTPYDVDRQPDERMYTYLDYTGRPVIIIKKANMVDAHIQDFQLEYDMDTKLMIIEPLMLVSSFYLLFLIVIIFARLDFTIAKDAMVENRLKLASLLERALSINEERMAAYDGWLSAIDKTKTNRDMASVVNYKKKCDGDFKRWGSESNDIAAQAKQDSPEVSDKLGDIAKFDKQIREQLVAWSNSVERLVQGKANKQQYSEVEKVAKGKIEEWKAKMEHIVNTI